MRSISRPPRPLDRDAEQLRDRLTALSRLRALRDPIAMSCEDAALTPPQIHALLSLGTDGPLAMGELARRVGVTEKTVTGLVDRLERDGFVQRERDAGDRRVVHARLTSKGTQISARMNQEILRKLGTLLGLLDAPDRKALLRIVDKVVARLAEPAAGTSQP